MGGRGMAEGGDDGWAAMAVGGSDGWVVKTDAVALRSLSFPRKRESRGLLRQERWHWTGGLGFLVPGRGRGRAPGE